MDDCLDCDVLQAALVGTMVELERLRNMLATSFSDHIDTTRLVTPQGIIDETVLMLEQMMLWMP